MSKVDDEQRVINARLDPISGNVIVAERIRGKITMRENGREIPLELYLPAERSDA